MEALYSQTQVFPGVASNAIRPGLHFKCPRMVCSRAPRRVAPGEDSRLARNAGLRLETGRVLRTVSPRWCGENPNSTVGHLPEPGGVGTVQRPLFGPLVSLDGLSQDLGQLGNGWVHLERLAVGACGEDKCREAGPVIKTGR